MVLKNTVVAPWRLGAHSPQEGVNDPPVGPSVGRPAGRGWGYRGDPHLAAGHAAQHLLAQQSGERLLLLFLKGDDPLHPLALLFFLPLFLLAFPSKGMVLCTFFSCFSSLSYLFFFVFLDTHSSLFNGPLIGRASPLYRFVTHIPGSWVRSQRLGRHIRGSLAGEGKCRV